MTVWYTADLHLGHRNIIRYCHRPYADVDEMNAALLDGWRSVVGPDDVVWVLGDVALGRIEHSLALVAGLPGEKHLVAGNHDRCWAGHGTRARGWEDRYRAAGFTAVHQGTVATTVGGADVLLCHFPYDGDSQDRDRFVEHRPVDRGGWLLHGHVHERWRQRGRMINVGVDVHDYRPVAEDALAALLAAGPLN
jgi:calcineurin-like phosphoesterase family protein